MRIQLSLAALIVAGCGGVAATDETPKTEPVADENPIAPAPTQASAAGPNCHRDQTLAEVLELVQQDAHAMPDPWRERLIADRRQRFGAFIDFLGTCYKATPTAESAEQTADVQYWSLALGGAAITIEHALEDGSYGGISYVYPNAEPDQFTYVYITNAGFHTQGTIVMNGNQTFTASEQVTGHATITEVRSISRFDESGLTSMASEFLDNGEWKPGPSFTHSVTTDPFPRLHPQVIEAED